MLVACIIQCDRRPGTGSRLHMDAAGAAIATVSAQALSVVFAVVLLIKKEFPFTITKRFPVGILSADVFFLKNRTAAGTSGIPATDFLSGLVRICQPPGSRSILRLRSAAYDRKLCHCLFQLSDAVHGFPYSAGQNPGESRNVREKSMPTELELACLWDAWYLS